SGRAFSWGEAELVATDSGFEPRHCFCGSEEGQGPDRHDGECCVVPRRSRERAVLERQYELPQLEGRRKLLFVVRHEYDLRFRYVSVGLVTRSLLGPAYLGYITPS